MNLGGGFFCLFCKIVKEIFLAKETYRRGHAAQLGHVITDRHARQFPFLCSIFKEEEGQMVLVGF